MAEEIEWFVGIDWASQSHQVCLIDARGECLGRYFVSDQMATETVGRRRFL